MKLGTVEIDEYTKSEIDVKPDLVRRKLLKHLGEDLFDNDRPALRQLMILNYGAEEKLRELDIGFLSRSRHFGGETFSKVPEFAVYPFKENKFLDCVANYQNETMNIQELHSIFHASLAKGFGRKDKKKIKIPEPPKATEEGSINEWTISAAALWGAGTTFGVQLRSQFLGLVPTSTKRKIRKAKGVFEEIDLIAEATWQERKIQAEPLVVGVWRNKVYLIDQFDTTNMEKYILSEFLI